MRGKIQKALLSTYKFSIASVLSITWRWGYHQDVRLIWGGENWMEFNSMFNPVQILWNSGSIIGPAIDWDSESKFPTDGKILATLSSLKTVGFMLVNLKTVFSLDIHSVLKSLQEDLEILQEKRSVILVSYSNLHRVQMSSFHKELREKRLSIKLQ